MPIHDWTHVDAGLFHDFDQSWTVALRNALNAGGLPPHYFALVEQNIRGPIPDDLTLKLSAATEESRDGTGALAVAAAPPRTRLIKRNEVDLYADKASRADLRALVEKSTALIRQGVHMLVIDLFPPSKRDPQGILKAIWSELGEEGLELPPTSHSRWHPTMRDRPAWPTWSRLPWETYCPRCRSS